MVIVIVSGIPKGVKLPKFIGFIKGVIFRQDVDIQSYTKPIVGTRFKEMSFIMKSNDARKAVRSLNGFQFRYANEFYPLACWIDRNDEPQVYHEDIEEPHHRDLRTDEYEPPRKSGRYESSPDNSSNELGEIDLKIKLIRKQRILMEEETKLLLEKKKIKFLQDCGSDDVEKLKQFDEVLSRKDPNEMSDFLNSALQKPSEVTPIQPKVKTPSLPKFLGPCKLITAQMKPKINMHSEINDGNKKFLWKLLRPTLKKRIYSIVQGQGYLPCKFIVRKYREVYPKSTDNDLINELLKTINGCCWPTKKSFATNENLDTEKKTEKLDADFSGLNKTEESLKPNNFVDLDEFVDMENEEDWDDYNDNVDDVKETDVGDNKVLKVNKDFAKSCSADAGRSMQACRAVTDNSNNDEESKNNDNDAVNTVAPSIDRDVDKKIEVGEKNHVEIKDADQLKKETVMDERKAMEQK